MDRKKLMIIGGCGILSLVVAILLLVLGISLSIAALPKVFLVLTAVLCFVLAAEFGYFTFLCIDIKPNYFLYNTKTKRNMSVKSLNFSIVNSRMNRFLSNYASSEGKLWNDRIFDNPYLEIESSFKPLIAYKMLFGLAETDSEAGWKCLENASEDTVKFICDGLSANGETAFLTVIVEKMNERPVNIKYIRDYLVKNKKYIQSKMTKYVVDNIDKF